MAIHDPIRNETAGSRGGAYKKRYAKTAYKKAYTKSGKGRTRGARTCGARTCGARTLKNDVKKSWGGNSPPQTLGPTII